MKLQYRTWILRLAISGAFMFALLLIIVINPVLTYGNKTRHKNLTIYHHAGLDPLFVSRLDSALYLLKRSEFYDGKLELDICLNGGSNYAYLIKAIRGQAFAWGFYNKVVLQGTMNSKENYVELNGYKWNLTQLLAHEMIHCLQFDKLGFWKSNPIADIEMWKWEGYAEYVSRQNGSQKNLIDNLDRLNKTDKNSWEISLADGTVTPSAYFSYWTLVQYCLDIRKMSYQQLLIDTTSEQRIRQEKNYWYKEMKKGGGYIN